MSAQFGKTSNTKQPNVVLFDTQLQHPAVGTDHNPFAPTPIVKEEHSRLEKEACIQPGDGGGKETYTKIEEFHITPEGDKELHTHIKVDKDPHSIHKEEKKSNKHKREKEVHLKEDILEPHIKHKKDKLSHKDEQSSFVPTPTTTSNQNPPPYVQPYAQTTSVQPPYGQLPAGQPAIAQPPFGQPLPYVQPPPYTQQSPHNQHYQMALTNIKSDHSQILINLASLLILSDPKETMKLFNDTIKLCSQHDVAEEVVLYSTVKNLGLVPLADASIDGNRQMEKLLYEMDNKFGKGIENFDLFHEDLLKLKELFQFHVGVLDREMFPELESKLALDDIDDINKWYDRTKAVAPTRPHPSGPHSATGQLLTGPLLSFVDRFRDLGKKFTKNP